VSMIDSHEELGAELAGKVAAAGDMEAFKASGAFDELMEQIDAGRLQIDGKDGFLNLMIKAVLERGLQTELSEHLGYEKGDPAKGDPAARLLPNSRNGSYPKTVASTVGDVGLAVPRDRAGTFSPQLVPMGSRRTGGLDDMIISLYAGGMTIRDIAHHLESTIGTELSRETISKISDDVLEEVMAWQSRPLDPILYLDAIVVKIRDGHQVKNKAAHIAVGVDLEGVKHVLGIWIQVAEGPKFWAGVCAELANRGIKDVLIACCDGLTGFPEAIQATWANTTVQTCVVHLIPVVHAVCRLRRPEESRGLPAATSIPPRPSRQPWPPARNSPPETSDANTLPPSRPGKTRGKKGSFQTRPGDAAAVTDCVDRGAGRGARMKYSQRR
jgi:putative transposase